MDISISTFDSTASANGSQYANCFPLCHRTEIGDACQTATTVERMTANTCHAVRDCDTCQSATTVERRIANTCHTVRDRDTCQIAITGERRIANTCHATIQWNFTVLTS